MIWLIVLTLCVAHGDCHDYRLSRWAYGSETACVRDAPKPMTGDDVLLNQFVTKRRCEPVEVVR